MRVGQPPGCADCTREHVLLARRIGVPALVVALNKADVADPELLDLIAPGPPPTLAGHQDRVGALAPAERIVMADHELAHPDQQLLDAVARITGVGRVLVVDETLTGESRSTFAVAAAADELIVKVVPGAPEALDNQRRLVRIVRDLRRRGYPAPEYIGVGTSGDTIFTVQRRLPGQMLRSEPGMPPAAELFAAVLPSLLAAIELQKDAGDLAKPPWPTWLLDTIETGGNGYCLHSTMLQDPRTTALLWRLQTLARRNRRDAARTHDVVHFDMNPANILHTEGRLSGVVDWNIPFDGAGQGDRGFDVATLLFYGYDIEQTRPALWERALELSGLAWTTVYLCHLSLRQVEWSRRHSPGSADEARFMAIAEAVLHDCEQHGA
jgi:aminoglycoside phosphotransferase (APT) family kinase protein